jgi:hypothetical protein
MMPVAEGKTLNVVGSVKRDWTPVSTNEVTGRKGEAEERLAAVSRDVVMEDQARIQLHLPFMDLHVEVPSELLESRDAGREESRGERCRGK